MIRINGEDMKELAMFYNFSDERFRKAKFALMPLKIQVKKVEKEDFNQPIGFLAGIKGIEPVAEKFDGDGFDEEMIVMHNFTNKTIDSLIRALNKCGVGRIPLKAVITPTSKDWDSLTLIKALKADHEEMLKKIENEKLKMENESREDSLQNANHCRPTVFVYIEVAFKCMGGCYGVAIILLYSENSYKRKRSALRTPFSYAHKIIQKKEIAV